MAARLVQPHAPTDAEQMQDYLINWNAGPLGVVLRPDLGADMPPVVAQMLPQPSVLKMAGVREGDLLISVNGKKTTRLGYEKVVRLLFKERLPMVLHFRSPLQVPEMQRGVSGAIAEEPSSARGGRSRACSSSRPSQQPKSRSRGRSDVDTHALIEQKRNPNVQNFSIDSDVSTKSEKKKSKRKHKHKHGAEAEAEERRLRKQYSVVWERGSLGISFRAYNSKVNVPCVDFISASRGLGRGMDRVCVNDVLISINGEKTKALGVEKVLRWLHVIEKPVVLRFHASSNRILNPAGGLLPQLADEDASERPRRPTMPLPLPQPEYEPPPRPPRRNNSVDQPMPQQRMERGYSDDREYELQPAIAPRRYSRDSATYFEQQPIEDYDAQYQFGASKIETKERRYSKNSMNAYAHGHDEDGVAGDFRREPKDDRHQQRSEEYFNQPHLLLPPPVRIRTNSASRDDIRRQQQLESKPAPPLTTDAADRPRLASRDSQVSNSSHLSFEEATGVVARAAGKPKEECEFGGVPLLDIKEGTVQAKLMYIYAKACLAKEGSSDDEPAPKDPQPSRTPGNPLGRKTHSNYLSYTILQDDAVASNPILSQTNGDAGHDHKVEPEEHKLDVINDVNSGHELKRSGIFSDNLDESFAKMQKDISIQQPPIPVLTPSLSSAGPSSPVSSDATPTVTPAPAPVTPAEDFISLKDFVMKGDGRLSERHTTSSLNSTATPVQPTDGGETDKTDEQQDKQSTVAKTEETTIEASSGLMLEELKSSESKETVRELVVDELEVAEPMEASGQETEEVETGKDEVEQKEGPKEEPIDMAELEEEHADETLHEEDDAASVDSSNERDLAASVASLDDLLDLKDGNHDDEEHEEFVDDDEDEQESEKNEKSDANEKETMNTSLGMKLDQVQEEETDDHDVHAQHEKEQEQEGHEAHDDDLENEDGALSNPLVNELFRNIPDVRQVIKDKPALVVLVKKTMIDEIQEILLSLQMELQLERHSTMAVGSTASPLRDSQQGRNTEGEHCHRCGATGELAELDVAGGQRELYCQECWELLFFSEDRQSLVARTSKKLAPSEAGRLSADEDALDEALKYSFHDSAITREDMIHPWRYLQGSDSISSSIRDSNDSSITSRTDEVWL
ncbi:uncharacterized protein PITG_02161 [Phytophthora infestans T30-4]|uniref:PDZ domain-containing protein n=1 Tax=Phytophthora infestans (strain T30-4) TaxID=403677 RepID=D0MVM4_PHYIT|nr:uncharacterized protein PITG_02161 [Phytophthora infestans T30-4]EEY63687.1 conserved hypothetical protein [Phytophthora infestans T30-4]|eukprot:XP_002907123.1 conserved hypothetical protein [Phytophthora infestans T30-4]